MRRRSAGNRRSPGPGSGLAEEKSACVENPVKADQSSWTAMMVATIRAIESEKPETERVYYDPLAKQFIGTIPYWFIRALLIMRRRSSRGSSLKFLYRCRFFDAYLQKGLDSGVSQVVILGAGWDSRAYRGELLQRRVKTFEVDHPATQAVKIRTVKRIFRDIPPHLIFVPVDFTSGTLDALTARGFDESRKTLFLWEGVTFYLNAEAVDSVLGWIGSRSAPGSYLIFDYKRPVEKMRRGKRNRDLLRSLAKRNLEQRDYRMEWDQLEILMARRGFIDLEERTLNSLMDGSRTPSARAFASNNMAIVTARTGKRTGGIA
jgi:methyltransferase (TIGR00027 family)